MFLTLQGEGLQAGRRALFIRFSGCNLWSGREVDRHKADCQFCDTDFVGTDGSDGGRYESAGAVADRALTLWRVGLEQHDTRPFTVITGGEPMLQLDQALIDALKDRGFEIAIETNGTLPVPDTIDWICVSPKAGTRVVQRSGSELKMVWPQIGLDYIALQDWAFDHFLVQPMDGVGRIEAQEACIRFVVQHPRWRLSVQTHKMTGIR